jgi:2-succinyl-5-enolpyruvyl-6-hydroxy-3-cyclohexene-1-carboxylate synthase
VPGEHIPLVAANRGASGIDGITSTACGFALGTQQPLVLVLGDMTFLHDINGLSFIAQLSVPLILVVANNNGNGIFRTLPIAQHTEVFERYFLTPHKYDLSHACKLYGVPHTRAQSLSEFGPIFEAAKKSGVSQVIEVLVE